VSECKAKGFRGDDGLLLGQIGLVDWFSSYTFGRDRVEHVCQEVYCVVL